MIVHQVKIGEPGSGHAVACRHRRIFVTSAETDLKYRDMLVFFRHRWEFYINGI